MSELNDHIVDPSHEFKIILSSNYLVDGLKKNIF